MKDPAAHLQDDVEDKTHFEIALINRKNQALISDCIIRMGDIAFDRFFIVPRDADEFIKSGIWFDKINKKSQKFYGQTHGPKFQYLSENLQNSIIEYLFACGLRPEIGLAVEYLSWNKEQRMYMGWLRDFYSHLFLDSSWSWELNTKKHIEEQNELFKTLQ